MKGRWPRHTCEGQRTTLSNRFSFSTFTWVLRSNSGTRLAHSPFTCWAMTQRHLHMLSSSSARKQEVTTHTHTEWSLGRISSLHCVFRLTVGGQLVCKIIEEFLTHQIESNSFQTSMKISDEFFFKYLKFPTWKIQVTAAFALHGSWQTQKLNITSRIKNVKEGRH